MIITIQEIHQEFTKNGDEYIKIKGTTGDGKETTKSIFNNLKDKWHLLKQNATLDFKMEKKGQFWNVVDISAITDKLPPPQEPKILPEHKAEIEKAKSTVEPNAVAVKGDSKNRSFALSYAKDISCALIAAGKPASAISTIDIAVLFESYLDNGAEVIHKKGGEK